MKRWQPQQSCEQPAGFHRICSGGSGRVLHREFTHAGATAAYHYTPMMSDLGKRANAPSWPTWAQSCRSRLLAGDVCLHFYTGHISREHESRLWIEPRGNRVDRATAEASGSRDVRRQVFRVARLPRLSLNGTKGRMAGGQSLQPGPCGRVRSRWWIRGRGGPIPPPPVLRWCSPAPAPAGARR